MNLLTITLQFRNKKEQKYVEDNCGFSVYEHETFDEDFHFTCWTDFDIEGCEPSDLLIFETLLDEYEKNEEE